MFSSFKSLVIVVAFKLHLVVLVLLFLMFSLDVLVFLYLMYSNLWLVYF